MSSVNRSALRDHAYDRLKSLFLTGKLVAGAQIDVEQCAESLDISRQPVMDALKRLKFEGFVTITPQVGCHVRSYRPEEVSDFFKVVAEVEPLGIMLAAQRASPEDILAMRVLSRQIGEVAHADFSAEKKAELYRTLNRSLHVAFGHAAKSGPIEELIVGFGDRCDFFISSAKLPIFFERLTTAHDEHEKIIAAIASRDGETGAMIMRTHILAIEKRLRAPTSSL